jgi:hypothetical protein
LEEVISGSFGHTLKLTERKEGVRELSQQHLAILILVVELQALVEVLKATDILLLLDL